MHRSLCLATVGCLMISSISHAQLLTVDGVSVNPSEGSPDGTSPDVQWLGQVNGPDGFEAAFYAHISGSVDVSTNSFSVNHSDEVTSASGNSQTGDPFSWEGSAIVVVTFTLSQAANVTIDGNLSAAANGINWIPDRLIAGATAAATLESSTSTLLLSRAGPVIGEAYIPPVGGTTPTFVGPVDDSESVDNTLTLDAGTYTFTTETDVHGSKENDTSSYPDHAFGASASIFLTVSAQPVP